MVAGLCASLHDAYAHQWLSIGQFIPPARASVKMTAAVAHAIVSTRLKSAVCNNVGLIRDDFGPNHAVTRTMNGAEVRTLAKFGSGLTLGPQSAWHNLARNRLLRFPLRLILVANQAGRRKYDEDDRIAALHRELQRRRWGLYEWIGAP